MTNAEKYKEVFGFDPDIMGCPTFICTQCPLNGDKSKCNGDMLSKWWTSEYKEQENEHT